MINKWQLMRIAVLDLLVDDGPMPLSAIVAALAETQSQWSAPRIGDAIRDLHRFGALLAFEKRKGFFYCVNTTQPQKLRAVWRGEAIVVPGDDVSCIVPGTEAHAQ